MGETWKLRAGLIPKGKSTVEMKPREAELSLSFLLGRKQRQTRFPWFCVQPRNFGLVGAFYKFPMTSSCIPAYFHERSRLQGCSRTASYERFSSAHGTAPVATSHTTQESVRAVNDKSDPEWIRAKSCFDQTVESICWRRARLVEASLRMVGSISLPGLQMMPSASWVVCIGLLGASTRDGELRYK